MGQREQESADLPVYYHSILYHAQTAAAQTGDDSGGNADSDYGQSDLRSGLHQAGSLSAHLYGVGEAVSGDLLFDAVEAGIRGYLGDT